ncbi:MAG: cupin domain-containing protein [Acidobacteriota bacterium]
MQREADVARSEPGPAGGGGRTTGFLFFEDVKDSTISFRKRVLLHPGSAIGPHEHVGPMAIDEVYYVISGAGEAMLDGKTFAVGPGDALLVRPGGSHGLRQRGTEDLVIIVAFQRRAE